MHRNLFLPLLINEYGAVVHHVGNQGGADLQNGRLVAKLASYGLLAAVEFQLLAVGCLNADRLNGDLLRVVVGGPADIFYSWQPYCASSDHNFAVVTKIRNAVTELVPKTLKNFQIG